MSTPHANPAGRIVRFGIFEADLAAGELRKSGRRIRLQEQPFQMLALLLERPGDLITREEVREKLWPADTFVDFDHGLNTAINKVRDALGDSAASPRFVETVARRGYRFLAPVQPAVAPVAETAVTAASPQVHPSAAGAIDPELQVKLPHRDVTRALFGLIQVMYLAFYIVALFRLRAIDAIAVDFLSGWSSFAIVAAVLVTAGVGIPLRCYLLSATALDYQRLAQKFQRLFLFILALDQLWAVVPFLLVQKLGFGGAFAATALLLYVPFSERTLIRMAYAGSRAYPDRS
jgi:cholera toxin transcriptional activator